MARSGVGRVRGRPRGRESREWRRTGRLSLGLPGVAYRLGRGLRCSSWRPRLGGISRAIEPRLDPRTSWVTGRSPWSLTRARGIRLSRELLCAVRFGCVVARRRLLSSHLCFKGILLAIVYRNFIILTF